MKTSPITPFVALGSVLLSVAPSVTHAQWTGVGAGGGGADFNNPLNWVGGDINGNFSGNSATSTVYLTDDAAVTNLNFGWSGAPGFNFTLDSDSPGTPRVLSVGGNILMPGASSAGSVTIGSGVTLDFGSITSIRDIQRGPGSGTIGTLRIDGLITGTASGSGALRFASNGTFETTLANNGNTFTAPLRIAGVLNYTSIANVGEGPSALGSATTVANGTIMLNRNAQLNYVGATDQSSDRAIVIENGGAGPVGIYHAGTGGKLTLTAGVDAGAYGAVLALRAINAGTTLEIAGAITNSEGGATNVRINEGDFRGTVILSNVANTYKGSTSLVGRTVLEVTKLSNGGEASSIGASSSDASNLVFGTWNYGATLRYVGTGDSTDRLFTMPREGARIESSGTGALHFTNTGVLSTEGAANRDGDSRLLTLGGVNTGDNTFAATLVDHVYNGGASTTASRFVKADAGKWALTGVASTYTGSTQIQGGILEVAKLADGGVASSIGASTSAAGNLMLFNGTTLRYTGAGDSTDRLFQLTSGSGHDHGATIESSGTGALSFTNTGSITYGNANQRRILTLGGTNTGENTLAATLTDNGDSNGVVSLVKSGSGKWILTGANTYTGATTVNEGTLLVNGSLAGAVIVNAGVFGGAGSTTGNVTIGNSSGARDALFAAGAGVGAFTTSGAFTFQSDAEFVFTFDSTTGVAQAASANGVTIHGSAFFSFNDIGDGSGVGLNDSFVILGNTGGSSITGTFANLANGERFTVNGITWEASYAGGDGNDLALTVVGLGSIPEPANAGVFASVAGLFLAAFGRRRRRS